jgi:hypothetical protein
LAGEPKLEVPQTWRPRSAQIIKGEYLELKCAERKRIQAYEDGSVFVRVSADNDYLSWGLSDSQFRQTSSLNTLALIEFSLHFCKLCYALSHYMNPQPQQIELNSKLETPFFGDSKLFLIPHQVSTDSIRFTDDRYSAPEATPVRELRVATDLLKSHPAVVAFLLVRKIFLWFGAPPDEIPYSSNEYDTYFIDENKIMNSRARRTLF